MFGSSTLDVVIGLSYLFVMLSLVASAVRETIEALLKTRAIQLEAGIRMLLDETVVVAVAPDAASPGTAAPDKAEALQIATGEARASMTDTLFGHPLLYSLFRGGYGTGKNTLTTSIMGNDLRAPFMSDLPAYIPSRSFALALVDTVTRGPVDGKAATTTKVDFAAVRAAVEKLPDNSHLKRALLIALDEAKGDLDRLHDAVAAWFDSAMERVSGWYKRQTQWILLAIGLFVAVAGNVDAVRIAQQLSADNVRRDAIVAQAGALYEKARSSDDATAIASLGTNAAALNAQAQELGYAVGWGTREVTDAKTRKVMNVWVYPPTWISPLGWLITAMAVSLGAPFWFDVLGKVMNIRSAMRPADAPKPAATGPAATPAPPPAPPVSAKPRTG